MKYVAALVGTRLLTFLTCAASARAASMSIDYTASIETVDGTPDAEV